MPEAAPRVSWYKRFLANRMAFESILFEKELVVPKPERKVSGLLGLLAFFVFHALLLTQAVVREGYLPKADAATVETAYKYAGAIDSGKYSQLFKPESFGSPSFKAPLYYVSFYLPLKLFPSSPSLALAAVNSFYLLLIMLSLYFSVRKGRNAASAWFAASLAASFPFVIYLGRHASADLAMLAFVAAAYCCYINSEGFEIKKWSMLFGISFCLGLLSDTRFILYVIPLVPLGVNAFLNPLTRKNVGYPYALIFLVAGPWYLRNAVFSLFTGLFVNNNFAATLGAGPFSFAGLLINLPLLADSLHLIYLALGVFSLLWLFISIFMAYEEKELVLSWFLLPYCIFALFSRAGDGNLYPALLPFALAAGIMMPNLLRKPLLGLTLLLAVLYQSGLMPLKSVQAGSRRIGLFGLDLVRGKDLKVEDALKAVRSAGGSGNLHIQLIGEDDYFNADSLTLLARKLGYTGMNFVRYPKDFMGLADFVIYKTAGFSSPYKSGPYREYSEEIASPGGFFFSAFRQAAEFEAGDTSKIKVYAKSGFRPDRLAPGSYTFPKLSAGGVVFEGAILDVGRFREDSGAYESVEVFIPQLDYQGVALYSLRFRFEGLSFMPLKRDFSEVRLVGCESVRIISLKLREETLNSLLKVTSSYFQNLSVRLDGGITVVGAYHNIGVNMGFAVRPTGAGFKLNLTRLMFGGIGSDFGGGVDYEQDLAEPEEELESTSSLPKLPPLPDMSQYSGDKVVGEALKISGYDKFIQNTKKVAKKEEVAKAAVKPEPRERPQPASGGGLASFLAGIFSMDFDLLDEKTLPFKVKAERVILKDGLLVLR